MKWPLGCRGVMSNLFVCPPTSGMSVVMRLEQWCQSSLLRVCELSGCRILSTVAGKITFFCEIWSCHIEAVQVSSHPGCYVGSWRHWDRFLSECRLRWSFVIVLHTHLRWHVALGSLLSLSPQPRRVDTASRWCLKRWENATG